MNSSSPHALEVRLLRVTQLQGHPDNSNRMGPRGRAKLRRHIERNDGAYPPIIVRPYKSGYQILDGHQRLAVLSDLGHEEVLCLIWPSDDETALLLLATLNRLRGEDVPALRGALMDELLQLMDRDVLLELIPEEAGELDDLLAFFGNQPDPFAELETETLRALADEPVTLTFVVEPGEEREVLDALDRLIEGRVGARSRGGSLVNLVRHHHGCELAHA